MLIMAIDPGPTESAWVLYDSATQRIERFAKEENLTFALVAADHLAIEMIASYGMPVGAEVFNTCVWIGRYIERWGVGAGRHSTGHTQITRHQVKMHLCKSPRAKDGNIRQALIDKFGPPGTKKAPGGTYGISGDVWAALAVAVTYAETFAGGGAT